MRRLTPAERSSFDHVDAATKDRARIRTIAWMPGSFTGITLGRTVFLNEAQPDDGTSTLIAHELVHVEQYRDRGFIGFLRWYLPDFVTGLWRERSWMNAYREIAAEREARERASAWLHGRRSGPH